MERTNRFSSDLFVPAYEIFAWVGSRIDRLDEQFDGAVEALITRAVSQTMAIEHMLIEPFVGDKRDYAAFDQKFLRIESDKSLRVPDTAIIVYVRIGILDGQKPTNRNVIVESICSWIENNRRQLREASIRISQKASLTNRRHTDEYATIHPRLRCCRRLRILYSGVIEESWVIRPKPW